MSFSEASNRELNNELQTLVAAGDEGARTRMIESNMRLAAFKVEQFVEQRPQFAYLKDDLLSEALVGLTEGVDSIRDTGVADNATALIAVCIDRQLCTAVANAPVVRPTRRGRHNGDRVVVETNRASAIERIAYEPSNEAEVLEEILACCATPAEHEIIIGRVMGKNNVEIGTSIGVDPRRVGEVIRRVEEKYNKRRES